MDAYWLFGNGPMSISCTPHFKPDAQRPWVTRESVTSLHYWYDPKTEQTLLEVAEQIEKWIQYDFAALRAQGHRSSYREQYNMNILCMEIRGVEFNREVLATKTTTDNFNNEEPFTLRFCNTWSRGGGYNNIEFNCCAII